MGVAINWLNFREILLKKTEPNTLFVREDFNKEHCQVNIAKRGHQANIHDLQLAWPNGHPISVAKKNDLRSIMFLVPEDERGDYRELLADQNIRSDDEDVDGCEDYESGDE